MSTIENNINLRVATAVRRRREQIGLTLRALATRSGVSPSMISAVEHGTKSPTIETLAALAEGLGVPLASLIDPAAHMPKRIQVIRAAERRTLVDPASGAVRDSFGPAIAGSRLEFLRYAVPPHAVAGPFPAHGRGTIEHIHLAAGRIRVTLGTEEVTLDAGDSCTCFADAPHGFDTLDGDGEALLYIVIESP